MMIGTLEIRDRFDDLTVGFRSLSQTFGDLASLSPRPVFGSPIQQSTKADYSWWHVPISIQIQGPWQKLKLSHCTVHLVTPGIAGPPIDMSWKTQDATASVNTMTLRHGGTALVPMVARREAADGLTLITNQSYLRDKKVTWNLNPRAYTCKLELRCGKKRWESPTTTCCACRQRATATATSRWKCATGICSRRIPAPPSPAPPRARGTGLACGSISSPCMAKSSPARTAGRVHETPSVLR